MGIGRRVSATANGALSAVGGVEKNDESGLYQNLFQHNGVAARGRSVRWLVDFACATPAYADEVSDAQNALSAAEARMSQIASEHEALVKQAEELQQQIDEATQGVMDAQAAAQTGRDKLGIYATQEYKTGGISLIKVLLESQSISDLVNNMQYFDAIQEDQARQIAEQKQLEATLNDALDDLNKKKRRTGQGYFRCRSQANRSSAGRGPGHRALKRCPGCCRSCSFGRAAKAG